MSAFLRELISIRFCRRVFIGVATAYAGVSLTLGGTASARPVFQSIASAWILLQAIWSFRLVSKSRTTGRLELVAFNIVLALVLAEAALRSVAVFGGTSLIISDSLEAHLLEPGRDYGDGLRGNRLGFPGPDFVEAKWAGVFRIAALGDSFALGPAVPFAESYLQLVENRLPHTEVYNFGVAGSGPREYRAALKRLGWTYRPDLVLVSVFVGNDITETLATPRHMDPRQLSLYLLMSRGWRLARENGPQTPAGAPTEAHRRTSPPLSPEAFREVEGRRLSVCSISPSPALERKWRRALSDLAGIVHDCRRHEVLVAVVLIPDEFQVNPEVLKLALQEAGLDRVQIDLDLPQRRLASFFAGLRVPCLDLLPLLKMNPHTYALRDTHWNIEGNHLAARAISDWLEQGHYRN